MTFQEFIEQNHVLLIQLQYTNFVIFTLLYDLFNTIVKNIVYL